MVTIKIEVDNPMLVGPLAETLMRAVTADMEQSMGNLEARSDGLGPRRPRVRLRLVPT